jgi:hypothetical protein
LTTNTAPPAPDYFAGLDLGQMADYTALAVLERTEPALRSSGEVRVEVSAAMGTVYTVPDGPPRSPVGDEAGPPARSYALRHLERWPLRTAYPDIVADVVRRYAAPPLAGTTLVVDRTGVGVAVFDLLRRARPKARLVPATITGGAQTACGEDGCWSVPKRELAGVLQVLLGTRRLKVSPALPLAKALSKELATFKVKVNIATGGESFEAWRERDHDDLVLATALAAWYSERAARQFWFR